MHAILTIFIDFGKQITLPFNQKEEVCKIDVQKNLSNIGKVFIF